MLLCTTTFTSILVLFKFYILRYDLPDIRDPARKKVGSGASLLQQKVHALVRGLLALTRSSFIIKWHQEEENK